MVRRLLVPHRDKEEAAKLLRRTSPDRAVMILAALSAIFFLLVVLRYVA